MDMSLNQLWELEMDWQCGNPWGHKDSDMNEWLNWKSGILKIAYFQLQAIVLKMLDLVTKYAISNPKYLSSQDPHLG